MQENHWLYYVSPVPSFRPDLSLPQGFVCEKWHPSLFSSRPKGMPAFPFAVWWLFHILHVFWNRDYALFVIRQNGKIVHRSVITPGYFRFPFMGKHDVQVGDTWTDPEVRGKGIATFALESVLQTPLSRKRTCWYVVEADNTASIRVVEKAGFMLTGRGIRTRLFGLGILGRYVLTEHIIQIEAEQTASKGA